MMLVCGCGRIVFLADARQQVDRLNMRASTPGFGSFACGMIGGSRLHRTELVLLRGLLSVGIPIH